MVLHAMTYRAVVIAGAGLVATAEIARRGSNPSELHFVYALHLDKDRLRDPSRNIRR